MDYSKLRKDISRRENAETVSVNHRALITRTLTKYPVDFALYRELLQNSADAKASNVKISFESSAPATDTLPENIHRLHKVAITRLTVKNNGQLFEQDDWNRLKEIAKGNPNESKIGAFGVGFYSVFEVTDEPLVHSGETVMSFYYSGDQLMYRRDATDKSDWTVVDLPYRTPGILPSLPQFTAFLTQSFMLVPLATIDLEINGVKLLQLTKVTSPTNDIPIASYLNVKSPDRTLAVKKVSTESFQATVTYMNATQTDASSAKDNLFNFGRKLFATLMTSSENPTDNTTVTCFLKKVTATVAVNVSNHFANKMKETVMKRPPPEAVVSMITSSREEQELSEIKPPLSDYIFPREVNDAKIFIGFATKQSTAIKSHIAMNQLIPTMERTAIDMSNAFVKNWNEQMLYTSGVLCRILYEHEMNQLKNIDQNEFVIQNSKFIMDKFTFQRSTPDHRVGEWITGGFYASGRDRLTLPSTQLGIKTSLEVRLPSDFDFFKKAVPILPKISPDFVERAKQLKFLKPITIEDVKKEVQSRLLPLEDFKLFVQWMSNAIRDGAVNSTEKNRILMEAVVTDGNESVQLGGIESFDITPDNEFPLPPTCIKFQFIKGIALPDLEVMGLRELNIVTWVKYISGLQDMQLDPDFAVRVLVRLNNLWSTIDNKKKPFIIEALQKIPCIPTQLGMQLPSEAYLVEIPMFPNLPVKTKQLDVVSNQFLFGLGLRESVDMAFVLKLLHNNESKWSTHDVVKYLSTHQRSLKRSDWELLRTSKFFESASGELSKAHELFAPHKDMEKLGFKTLKWDETNPWSESSPEAKLLFSIGLKQRPSIHELFFKGAESPEFTKIVMRYYLTMYSTTDSYDAKIAAKVVAKVIPCNDGNTYCAPSECYSDPKASLVGFPVVIPSLRAEAWKFGIEAIPSAYLLTRALLANLPRTHEQADKIYSFLSGQEFQKYELDQLAKSKCILIQEKNLKYQYPGCTFVEMSDNGANDGGTFNFLKPMFDFVKGSPQAAAFLTKIGVRMRPSLMEQALAVVENPNEAYKLAGSRSIYEGFLSGLSLGWSQLKREPNLVKKMQQSRFLIGVSIKNDGSSSAGDDETKELEVVSLVTATQVAIVDDVIAFSLFKEQIKTAPQVNDIETLYGYLGSPRISKIVHEQVQLGRRIENEQFSNGLKRAIVQRVTVFLDSRRASAKRRPAKLDEIRVQPLTGIEVERWAQMPNEYGPSSSKIRESMSACFDPRNDNLLYVVDEKVTNIDWYDVSKALVKRILDRPDPESVLILETMLSSNLHTLRKKGFNVDRLLKEQEQQQKRMQEKREEELARLQKEQEEMERQTREVEKQQQLEQNKIQNIIPGGWANQGKTSSKAPETQDKQAIEAVPNEQLPAQSHSGAEPTQSTPTNPPVQPPSISRGGMFDRLKKLGRSGSSTGGNSTGSVQQQTGRSLGGGEPVSTQDTANLLQQGLNDTRAYNSDKVQAPPHNIDDRTIDSGCHQMDPYDLVFAVRLENGCDCFVKRGEEGMSQMEMSQAAKFRQVLALLSRVYTCRWNSIHIFLDRRSKTVAFNLNGSLFFNLWYFDDSTTSNWLVNGMNYWYPVMAHELAHNLVAEHGANHAHFLEAYIQQYMENFKKESSLI